MIGYNRGDVVLVRFLFADETGVKQRPAVIVSSNTYQRERQEAIVAAITSRTDRILFGDYLISDWKRAGLLLPSVATGVIRTIKQGMIGRTLGTLSRKDLHSIEEQLRTMFWLGTGTREPDDSKAS